MTRLATLAESRGLERDAFISWMEEALGGVAAGSKDPSRELSEAEREVLAEEGLGQEPTDDAPVAASMSAYLNLVEEALPAARAAERMGVSASRVRQLLGARRLYGVKLGRDWRLPRWQFRTRGQGLVPGIEAVNAAFPTDFHPLSVEGILATPNPELELGGEPVSPLDWLRSGGAAETAARLAADL